MNPVAPQTVSGFYKLLVEAKPPPTSRSPASSLSKLQVVNFVFGLRSRHVGMMWKKRNLVGRGGGDFGTVPSGGPQVRRACMSPSA